MTPGAPTPSPPVHRAPVRWLILLLSWVIGLIVWSLYIGMLIVVMYRWLA